jgi:hypothetical protein
MHSSVTRRNLGIAVILATVLVQASVAAAQESSGPFEPLLTVLQPGDTIVITDTNGRRTAGKLRELTTSTVELQDPDGHDGPPVGRFAADDVRQIRFERHDSLLNGTLIGFAAGAAPGIVFIAGRRTGSDPIQDAGIAASIILVPGVMAAGVGALMDALFFEHRIVYKSTGQRSRVSVSPWLAESGNGLQVSLRF